MIGFAGLSHLGIVSSLAAAAKGFEVVAYDPDPERCAALNEGVLPCFEPGLADMLEQSRALVTFTSDIGELRRCSLIYVALDVATDETDRSELDALAELLESVLEAAPRWTPIVLSSQVPPSATRRWMKRIKQLDRPVDSLALYYQVETLVLGQAVERALKPERFIIGCEEPDRDLPAPLDMYLEAFDCPVFKMNYESAELAKIAINLYLVSSISTTNTLAELCESIGADWEEIAPTLRMDRRIGQHAYLKPGLGIAGGNLERDLELASSLAKQHGADAGVVDAWLAHCRHRREWVLRTVHAEVLDQIDDPVIAIWGLAYKPDTTSTKNSPALHLIKTLSSNRLRVYDPQVSLPTLPGKNVTAVDSALDACRGADALVVMTPWREFADLDPAELATALAGRVIIDPFGCLDPRECRRRGLVHHRLGVAAPAREFAA